MFYDVQSRQRQHSGFVNELDEPSTKLGGSDFSNGDATALYSFGVGSGGHPFHRHAGHRVFTAISGSGGAQLRFSSATPQELDADPSYFLSALRHVNVPPDCLFTVRFSGETWHQFAPLVPGSRYPAFFALSVHTNELGGELSDALRQQILDNRGDIPSLTQVLPQAVIAYLQRFPAHSHQVQTTVLSLDEQPGSLREVVCLHWRSAVGHLRGLFARVPTRVGFVSEVGPAEVQQQFGLPRDSLLRNELTDKDVHHEDRFTMTVTSTLLTISTGNDAGVLLAALLGSFIDHRHAGVSLVMRLRNWVVRPFRLRTSPLACPVSSLLSATSPGIYAGRYPVHSSHVSADGRTAQVILGADDKHLVFRSSVEVRCLSNGSVEYALSTRVACRNSFGRVYMALIAGAHRRYIAPRLLQRAVNGMGLPGNE